MDYPVSLTIDVPEMHWVISSRLISMWALQTRAGEVKVERFECNHETPRW